MTDQLSFVCTRWRRYGHDRLYVEEASGTKVGYRDLRTGLDHPVDESDRSLRERLADSWTGATPSAATGVVVPDSPAELAAPRPWIDLALNEPGRAARDNATTLRTEAPVRTTLARILRTHTDERAWRLGADGEQLVAAELDKVTRKRPAWTALHSIPVGHRGSDIDHLLIGPGGVFTVNAKHHKGADIWVGGETVMVNGARTRHVRNARFEAERATRLLAAVVGQPVPVAGLVVTVNARTFKVTTPPRPGVTVLHRKQLAPWLLRLGDTLDQELLNRIWDAARRSTTWEC
jgi:hypothetical protein